MSTTSRRNLKLYVDGAVIADTRAVSESEVMLTASSRRIRLEYLSEVPPPEFEVLWAPPGQPFPEQPAEPLGGLDIEGLVREGQDRDPRAEPVGRGIRLLRGGLGQPLNLVKIGSDPIGQSRAGDEPEGALIASSGLGPLGTALMMDAEVPEGGGVPRRGKALPSSILPGCARARRRPLARRNLRAGAPA